MRLAYVPVHAAELRLLRRLEVLVVGLVQHDEDILGNRGDERLQHIRRDPGPGRIVGIGDEHDARRRRDGGAHRRQVVAEVARRNLDAGRAPRLHGQRIDGEGVARIDGLIAGPQERLRHQLQDVVGAVAEDDPVGGHAVALRQRGLEREAVAVGVAAELVDCAQDRRPHRRARPARVLVGRELDDVALGQSEFAREVADRFSRNVRRQIAHVGRCLERWIVAMFVIGRRAHDTPNKLLQDTILIS